jgi:prepilin-type processing-associated H-X9-DG protein
VRRGHPAAPPEPRIRRAVTLVELIVVMAVITALAGLLLPSLSALSAAGRSTRCQSNLKQMSLAAHGYSAMWDSFPAAIWYDNKNGVFQRVAWDWVTTFSGQAVSAGPLWNYANNPGEVQQCPDFDGKSTFDGDPYSGYNYNTSYIGGEAPFGTIGWSSMRKGVSPSGCSRACDCAMFGDGGWKSGANKFMRAPENHEGQSINLIYSGGQAFRHRRCCNVAFVDGHIGAFDRPWEGKLHTPTVLAQYMNFPHNGFLTNDDRMYDPR